MAPSPSLELGSFYSQLRFILRQQAQTLSLFSKLKHTLAGEMEAQACVKKDKSRELPGRLEMSRWKKVDSRTLGVERSMIPESPWLVLKLLRTQGFHAYLVGGCVRDLLLSRIPKDFDVITTANLKKIRKIFHRSQIVGRRFPICMVNIKGSVVEVSSFGTLASHDVKEVNTQSLEVPSGYNKMDYICWRDSKRRDYTINSMFYDPFSNNIFDYANGMKDLSSSRLKTLIPAELSFKEDCARILRGLRIAARLGLSFSKETETAVSNLSFSIKTLSKPRLMMELNYMFSYGAAEPSIHLLRKFNLLEFLLPIQDAYLKQQHKGQAAGKSVMLAKLLSSLDQVVSCDKPCDCTLWIGLFAFHQALVVSPQDALVLWTFASILYHGDWSKALKVAREHEMEKVDFEPEISSQTNDHQLSDDELVERVSKFASTIQDSINTFCYSNCLANAMAGRYPSSPCSGLVLVSRKAGESVGRIFDVLLDRSTESHHKIRENYEINYGLLVQGNVFEKRFVMGKIIMDTLSSADVGERKCAAAAAKIPEEKKNHLQPVNVKRDKGVLAGVRGKVSEVAFDKVVGRVMDQGSVDVQEKVNENILNNLVMEVKNKKRKRVNKEESGALKKGRAEGEIVTESKVCEDSSIGVFKDMSSTENVESKVVSAEGKVKKRAKEDASDKNLRRKEEVKSNEMKTAPEVCVSKKSFITKAAVVAKENKTRNGTSLSSLFK